MTDELQIAALLYRYARAVDTKDWELYRSVFTDDAYIDYSSAGAAAGSRDEVADWLSQGFGAIPWTMHYITNIESDITGDSARVRAPKLPRLHLLRVCAREAHDNCGFALSPQPPIAHTRRRFRGHVCRAPCMTPHARGPA